MGLQIQYFPKHDKLTNNINFYPFSKILFVIVLYNNSLSESETFRSLAANVKLNYPDYFIDLLVCDNSLLPQINLTDKNINIYYLHDGSNPGVSTSYNRAAKFAHTKEKKWILVLDQDTNLPPDALKRYINALNIWPGYPLYAPKIVSSGVILSPCRYLFYRGAHFRLLTPGIHKLKYKNVLNSGLLINLDAFDKVGGYNEKVWLYFSDFVFFNKLKKHFKKFIVLDCKLEHSISSSDYSDIIFALSRFKYYCEGAKAACEEENNIGAYISYRFTIGIRSVKMYARFKDIRFINVFIKTFYK